MKRLLLVVAVVAFLFPAVRQTEAVDISIDFFYDNIGDGGSWVEVADYGYCWQPAVAVSNRSWRPYTDGYWAYTDVGWTWVSYEDFGWATYHYGRWIRLRGRGWVWVPGRDWGPAWVSWRTGGDYVGWAPLPPRGGGDVFYDSRPITAQVDVDFDIGPLYYNFIDVRYVGEPVLRERIFAPEQNVVYITKTVNVTNITYRDNQVYNYGPDYNSLNRYSTRPIQRLTLQRDSNIDPIAAARSRSLMKVQGDRLVIAAPRTLQKPAASLAPKVVKEKIAQTPLERGWEGFSDQKAQAELKQKIKSEDSKTVVPPTVQAVREETAASTAASTPATSTANATPAASIAPAATSPAASASSATAATPSVSADKDKEKDKDKDKDKEKKRDASSPPGPSPTISPAVSASVSPAREMDKDKKRDLAPSPAPSVAASVAPAPSPVTAPDKEKEKNKKRSDQLSGETPATTPGTTPGIRVPPATAPDDMGKKKQRDTVAPSASVPPPSGVTETAPSNPTNTDKADKRKPKKDNPPPPPVDNSLQSTMPAIKPPPAEPATKRNRVEPVKPDAVPEQPKQNTAIEPRSKPPKNEPPVREQAAPPAPAANAPGNPPAREEGKKKKKDEPAATPAPTP